MPKFEGLDTSSRAPAPLKQKPRKAPSTSAKKEKVDWKISESDKKGYDKIFAHFDKGNKGCIADDKM